MWLEQQAHFSAALLDPREPAPAAIAPQANGTPDGRFDVYRNNVTVGLTNALNDAFPVVAALVGTEFFAAMAQAYLRHEPPASPILFEYGDGFADFISTFKATDGLPYLADVARLERAATKAYHAADEQSVEISMLSGVDDSTLADLRLRMHPSLALISSQWPVASIWHAHQSDDPATALAALPQCRERIVVTRPGLEVRVQTFTPPVFDLAHAIANGATLGEALEGLADTPDSDASACLARLFEAGAVVGVA